MTEALSLDVDDFRLFGMEPKFAVDLPALDAQWRRLQSEVHPDRFVQSDDASAKWAMQWSMRINQGYRRLRDPVSRAAYLCELRGASIDLQGGASLPVDFLMQQMEWREALSQARTAQDVESLEADVKSAVARWGEQLVQQLDHHPDPGAGAREAVQTVQRLMFLTKFQQDIDRKMDALQS